VIVSLTRYLRSGCASGVLHDDAATGGAGVLAGVETIVEKRGVSIAAEPIDGVGA
jgi:hypothetical protein